MTGKKIVLPSYFKDFSFVRNNYIYQNLAVKKCLTISMQPTNGKLQVGHRVSYTIIPHNNNNMAHIHKRGYRNIRCNYDYLIDNIELEIAGYCIHKIDNTNGEIFPQIRRILNIQDNTIIPLLPNNKYLPFFDLATTRLVVSFRDTNEFNLVDKEDIMITYDEVEIDMRQIIR